MDPGDRGAKFAFISLIGAAALFQWSELAGGGVVRLLSAFALLIGE
jgi:hypothetical protein